MPIQIQHALSDEQAIRLMELIVDHVAAQVALSWAGRSDPDDRPVIEAEATLAQAKLQQFIDRLWSRRASE